MWVGYLFADLGDLTSGAVPPKFMVPIRKRETSTPTLSG
jgi:hypothetical protein